MKKIIDKILENKAEIFKFIIVGGIATVIDFVVFALIIYFSDPVAFEYNFFNSIVTNRDVIKTSTVILATALGFFVAFIFNYILSVFFVFENGKSGKNIKGSMLFLVFAVFGLLLNIFLTFIGYDLLEINQWIVKIITTGLVLIFNYLTRKLFIFKKPLTK